MANIIEKVMLTFAAILISIGGYFYIKLDNKVDEQSKQIAKIENKISVVISILSMKMPDVNLPVLMSIAAQKEIPVEKVRVAVSLLSNDHEQAKAYLKSQMQFNDKEVNLIMQPMSLQANDFPKRK